MTYTLKQFLLIVLAGLVLATILGTIVRILLGVEAVTHYGEQIPVDALGGLMVMLLGLVLYFPVHLFRHLKRSKDAPRDDMK